MLSQIWKAIDKTFPATSKTFPSRQMKESFPKLSLMSLHHAFAPCICTMHSSHHAFFAPCILRTMHLHHAFAPCICTMHWHHALAPCIRTKKSCILRGAGGTPCLFTIYTKLFYTRAMVHVNQKKAKNCYLYLW